MSERRLINPANWPYFDHSKMPYSLAAEKDGILFLSGQTAERENPETGKIECTGDADRADGRDHGEAQAPDRGLGGEAGGHDQSDDLHVRGGESLLCRTTRGRSAHLQRSLRKRGEAISGRTMRREPGFTCRAT